MCIQGLGHFSPPAPNADRFSSSKKSNGFQRATKT
jgi:hypothetical protein